MAGPDGKRTTARVRTTELLQRANGKCRYVVDHASVGFAAALGEAITEAGTVVRAVRQ
jgi:hypothetical protein